MIIENPAKYKWQVIYTRIDRDENGKPSFTEYVSKPSKRYFYPASTVKLPMSVITLMKLKELKSKGIDKTTPFGTDSAYYCQEKIKIDSTSGASFPTAENYIKRMLLVSDNTSFTRLYEFVGFDYVHNKLKEMGYPNVRLLNRLSGTCKGDTAKITPPVFFLGSKGDTIYKQAAAFPTFTLQHPIKNSLAGRAYSEGKKRIHTPKDFSRHNYLCLSDLNSMMKKLVFNDQLPEKERWNLAEEDRAFLLKQMGSYPKESEYPLFDKEIYYDSYKKYFLHASAVATVKHDSIRCMNIVGKAYGFLIDCAYIVDMKNKIEFMLTISVYVNKKDVIGSGKYEYDALGLPFLRDLSWCIYDHERKRKRNYNPDLNEFEKMFHYKPE